MEFNTKNETRRRKVLESTLNAIDYLEVIDLDEPVQELRQRRLNVFLLKPMRAPVGDEPTTILTNENIRISGGDKIQGIEAVDITIDATRTILTVEVDRAGDFSVYNLSFTRDRRSEEPPAGFDLILSQVDFTFKAECPRDFDCLTEEQTGTEVPDSPPIDYLTKDYTGFRRLMLDRMSALLPEWTERNPADVGVTIVELLAYAADKQSYFQDAVATEAYLNTARKRVSVRRHARLLDYPMHDGCNARTLMALYVDAAADSAILNAGTEMLTTVFGQSTIIDPEDLSSVLIDAPQVFETLHDLTLLSARNEMALYAWGEPDGVLAAGSTSAVLRLPPGTPDSLTGILNEGDVVIFQELISPETGNAADADRDLRHAVRLTTAPIRRKDELFTSTDYPSGVDVLEIEWNQDDALPFDLRIGEIDIDGNGTIQPVTAALGNIVLVDHGLTLTNETLNPPEAPDTGTYRPELRHGNITQTVPYDDEAARKVSVTQALNQDHRLTQPAVKLATTGETWVARKDLLNSDRFATEFVVETEDNEAAKLRFGDNILGKRPPAGTRFDVTYRIGNGRIGNVGPGAITHVVTTLDGINTVYNPMSALGGVEPETIEHVQLHAPRAFRTQERAVTEEDYIEITERHPEVQKARARMRWTGSWHSVFISLDRRLGRPVDDAFKNEIQDFLDPFRMTGHDLEIREPRFAALDIILRVRVGDTFLRSEIKTELLRAFSTGILDDGNRAFFHPDNFTFGQTVYLSRVTEVAMAITGVDWIDTVKFGRFGSTSRTDLNEGRIILDQLEIIRLDNDLNAPENGKIEFIMEGGI